MRRAWQGIVLGITVDLSALPYLLRLLPGPTPSRRPGRSFPVGPDRVGREREASKDPTYPRSKERGRSRTVVPPRPGLPVGDRIVVSACYCVFGPAQTRIVAAPPAGPSIAGKQVHWGPRVYEADTLYPNLNRKELA